MQTISTKQDTVAAANDVLRQRLRRVSIETLIEALIRLTHEVHDAPDPRADRVREQREFVIGEIKRRADRPAVSA